MGARQSVVEGSRGGGGGVGEERGGRPSRSLSVPTDPTLRTPQSLPPDSSDSSDGDIPSTSSAIPASLERFLSTSRRTVPRGGGGHPLLPPRLPFALRFFDIKCPVCNKTVASDEAECHLVMCLTRPRITYNEDVLDEDKGECPICLEPLSAGESIARLPCLCIYHKTCIDSWFKVKNCCPEHPGDDG